MLPYLHSCHRKIPGCGLSLVRPSTLVTRYRLLPLSLSKPDSVQKKSTRAMCTHIYTHTHTRTDKAADTQIYIHTHTHTHTRTHTHTHTGTHTHTHTHAHPHNHTVY